MNHGLQASLCFYSLYISLEKHQHFNLVYDITSVFLLQSLHITWSILSRNFHYCFVLWMIWTTVLSKQIWIWPWFMMKIFLLTWSQLCFRWLIHIEHFLVIVNSKCFQFYSLQIYAPIFVSLVSLYYQVPFRFTMLHQ